MEYERIPYTSFMWKFGTTSFRTKEFNFKTERQLALLDDFWKISENSGLRGKCPWMETYPPSQIS